MSMVDLTIGSLFSGFGGLDMAVARVLNGRVVWHCEWDDNPSRILAHHWPDVPNYRDVTAVDWTAVESIDVLTGGFPCQDVSHAGRRAGLIRDGEGRTRSGLWGEMLKAVDTLRPALVVAENVRGLLSAAADSDVEPCPWCVGGAGDTQPPMRALGAVLADLADVGYDAAWVGLPASDVGAPHARFRVFVLAWPTADAEDPGVPAIPGALAAPTGRAGNQSVRDGATPLTLLPTPVADNSRGLPSTGTDYQSLPNAVTALLPTPAVNDMGRAYTPEEWDAWTEKMRAAHGNGNGHGASLHVEALRMLPTPRAGDGDKGGPNQRGSSGDLMLPSAVTQLLPTPIVSDSEGGGSAPGSTYRRRSLTDVTVRDGLLPTPSVADVEGGRKTRSGARSDELLLNGLAAAQRFGDYAPAIVRWEAVLGRPAPDPTEPTGKGGGHRLSPRFVEWMMGLPDGHVTDPAIWHGLKASTARNAQLKALGNGVVPPQAEAALEWLLRTVASA